MQVFQAVYIPSDAKQAQELIEGVQEQFEPDEADEIMQEEPTIEKPEKRQLDLKSLKFGITYDSSHHFVSGVMTSLQTPLHELLPLHEVGI